MGKQSSNDSSVHRGRNAIDTGVRAGSSVARNRLITYVLVTLAIAFGVGSWDHHQRNQLAENNRKADARLALNQYNNCRDLESVKAQANERIELLKVAQKAVIFKTPEIERELASLVERVKPLAKVDCTPLRPGK